MKIVFSSTSLDAAPKTYARVRFTGDEAGAPRLVKESEVLSLELGVGKSEEMSPRKFILVCREVVQAAKKLKIKKLALEFGPYADLFSGLYDTHATSEWTSQTAAENFEMANYEFNAHKTPPKEGWPEVDEIFICGLSTPSGIEAAKRGQIIGQAVNECRTLANTPGGDMTPTILASEAKKAAKGLPVKVSVMGRKEMQKLGMGAVLGVAKGSSEEPKFITVEYTGSKDRPIVLVGKGVTFDSGGLNIKTEGHMYEMHMDMSGGAAAITAVVLAARLKLKKHVVALVPAVENMSSANAVRPGDVLKSLSGKTIEVIDTDAEGRLILSDALTYAKRFNPSVVLDTATLTGSSLSALGTRASALFTKDDKLAEKISMLGEVSGDYVWRLPLWDEYEENIKGTFADLVNLPESPGARKGDVINAATFLWQFAKDIGAPWAHIDMVPKMTSTEADKLAKGAMGTPVRLFIRFIEAWQG